MFHVEQTSLKSWKASLKPREIEFFELYTQELEHFNKNIPLYSRGQASGFVWELILDSYLASQALLKDTKESEIVDIGSGAGFPGLILAHLAPSKKLILLDSNPKKTHFLEYMVWKTGLQNVEVRTLDIQQEQNTFICAVSKAFFSLNKRLELTRSALKKGSSYYQLQTLGWEKQWNEASVQLQSQWQIKEITQYASDLPLGKRCLLRADLK